MRRSLLVMCMLSAVATSGCDKVKALWTKVRGGSDTTATVATDSTQRAGDSLTVGGPAGTQRPTPPPPRRTASAPVQDSPYTSQDTGTIDPGMTERDVYSRWGAPVEVRNLGEFTYIYYPNGCERTCGTADVVILQNGQVVDAIVRWPGHAYSGVSSSPPGKTPSATRGGDTLTVRPQQP